MDDSGVINSTWRSTGTLEDFKTPGYTNAPAAYWFWHRIPKSEEIRTQILDMKNAGYQSFQIQTRMSFPLDQYLSKPYLAKCREAADEAAKLGMKIGIYDEYNWLSGHAGGRVVKGHDELRERHLFHCTSTVTEGYSNAEISGIHPQDVAYLLDSGMNWVFEGGTPQWDQWQIVLAIDPHTGADLTSDAEIVQEGKGGCRIRVKAPSSSNVTVFLGARCCSSRMINYLDPKAAQRFVEVGYQPYADAFASHMGETVKYVFYDQPHACFFTWDQNDGPTAATLMYDPQFYAELKDEFAEDWSKVMLSIALSEVGDDLKALRARFFAKYSEQATSAFFGTLRRWCHHNNVLLSGHEVLAHVSCWDPTGRIITDDPRSNFGVDYFRVDSYRDITGVDARNEYPQLPAKFGDSVARSNGRSGCIVEQYFGRVVPGAHFAAGWWELTLAQLRDQSMRHHILGARQILMHAYWLTDGYEGEDFFINPRFDFAPGVNFEPWFKHHRSYAEESGRVSVFLDGIEPMGEVALFYPLRTAWAEGPNHEYGKHFAYWAENMARSGIDYHIIDERDLKKASPQSGRMVLTDGREYRTVVLPDVTMLADKESVETLSNLADGGVTIISSGDLPHQLEYGSGQPEVIRDLTQRSNWTSFPTLPAWDEAFSYLASSWSENLWVEDLSGGDGQLWSRRGRNAKATRIVLFNDSSHDKIVHIRPTTNVSVFTRWDQYSGMLNAPYEVHGIGQIAIAAGEVILLEVHDQGSVAAPRIDLIENWSLSIDGVTKDINPAIGWQQQGYADYSGVGLYQCRFNIPDAVCDEGNTDWQLILPAVEGTAEISFNGTQLGQITRTPSTLRVPRELLVAGENLLSIEVSSSAANYYYKGTSQQANGLAACGLAGIPFLRPERPIDQLDNAKWRK